MILIPYFIKQTDTLATLGVFLRDGGSSLWSVDDKATLASIKSLLKENGIPSLTVKKKDGAFYANIDTVTLDLNEFYLWNEVPFGSENDVWRLFKIPLSLWSCSVFRETFSKDTSLPPCVLRLLDEISGTV
jgi:hypothetical protein